jgi:hypothetical protein
MVTDVDWNARAQLFKSSGQINFIACGARSSPSARVAEVQASNPSLAPGLKSSSLARISEIQTANPAVFPNKR